MSDILRELKINEDQRVRANELYSFANIRNSFTKGKSQLYGALGEIVIIDYLNLPEKNYIGSKDYDILYNDLRIDVKTKKVNSIPKGIYFNSIAVNSLVQDCDAYIFVRVNKEMTMAWLCGFITKKEFMTNGVFYNKGDVDPFKSSFSFKESCMNLDINSCYNIKQIYDPLVDLKAVFSMRKINDFYEGYRDDYEVFYLPSSSKAILKHKKKVILNISLKKEEDFNVLYDKMHI